MASSTTLAPHTVEMDQLCIGLHVKLASWAGHPFLFSSFKIRDQKQIDTLQSLGLSRIEYLPHMSDAQPSRRAIDPPTVVENTPADGLALVELMKEKKGRIETLNRDRELIQVAEHSYVKTANSVRAIMRLVGSSPALAAQQSQEVATRVSEIFLATETPFVHLMGDNISDDSNHFHCLNVTVLSMILARAIGMVDVGVMREIAQGAVLHDVGKVLIPSKVLLKNTEMTQSESRLFETHTGNGIKIMQPVENLPRRVLDIILLHHEMIDGSGYPQGLKGDAIDRPVRIVSIANAYDNLCNPRIRSQARTPSEALSFMYKNESAKYDTALLSAFIKSMGIYPPGTVVVLKSGKVGIVMSVDSGDMLHPNLMIYDAAIPKQQAAVVNLRRDLEDSVVRTLRPSALPEPVFDYLSPRKRVSYFVANAQPN